MRLLCASVSGFRRFGDKVTVRLTEPLIAVVGSNEAGKSSFLEALRKLDNDDPISDRDVMRRSDLTPQISLTFELEKPDHDVLASLELSKTIPRCTLLKNKTGKLELEFDLEFKHDPKPRSETQPNLRAY